MLWSLIKILIFVVIVGGIVYGIEWIVSRGEMLQVSFAGVEVTLAPLQTLIAVLLLFVAVWVILRVVGFVFALLKFLLGDETAVTRYFNRHRERRGHRFVSEGLLALAEGDTKTAMRKAQKAEARLTNDTAPWLLAAQAAEQSGDRTLAVTQYKKLLEDDKTKFVAVHGLMRQKQAEGDEATARKLAENALKLQPAHSETADQLFLMQTHDSDWSGARRTLGLKRRYKTAPKDMAKRRDGLLALCQARDFRAAGDMESAHKAAIDATAQLPNFAPAVVEGARAYMEMGQKSKAASILRAAWASEPHPSLAAAYAEIDPNETPEKRIKRFGDLVRKDPTDPEARMLMAELHIAGENFPEARRALGDLVDSEPTARVLTLMAAIERGEGGNDTAVKAWLAKAVTAPRGPQWVCETEGAVYAEWQPVCDVCGAFDTLTWKPAPASEVMPNSSAGMLPLIVGALEDKGAAAEDVTDAEEVAEVEKSAASV